MALTKKGVITSKEKRDFYTAVKENQMFKSLEKTHKIIMPPKRTTALVLPTRLE